MLDLIKKNNKQKINNNLFFAQLHKISTILADYSLCDVVLGLKSHQTAIFGPLFIQNPFLKKAKNTPLLKFPKSLQKPSIYFAINSNGVHFEVSALGIHFLFIGVSRIILKKIKKPQLIPKKPQIYKLTATCMPQMYFSAVHSSHQQGFWSIDARQPSPCHMRSYRAFHRALPPLPAAQLRRFH